MIVVPNAGASVPAWPRRRWLRGLQWALLLGLMVLIYGSHAPLIALSKVDGHVPFSPSSCVVMIEAAKLLVSLTTILVMGGVSTLLTPPSLSLLAPYSVPAILYALNNNLVVLMQGYMDPSSYQVLSNLKIASTAFLYTLCLGKRLRPAQWFALGLLMAAGACHSYISLDLGDLEGAKVQVSPRLHITAWGLVLVLTYCLLSGLAAVYTEKMLKTQPLSLSLQNLYLYGFGVTINLVSFFCSTAGRQSFLEGFSGLVWLIVIGQAANGLLMSVVLKHGTGITRLFVISCSMLVNVLLSWAFLGLHISALFLLPVSMIGLAAYLYYR